MQPPAGETVSHWGQAGSFPQPCSGGFMSAMSIQMAVITNRNTTPPEEGKNMSEEQTVTDTNNLKQHHEKKANQKKDNKAKLSKLLAVRKVSNEIY